MASINSHVYVHRCKNSYKTVYGNSKCFEVKVGIRKVYRGHLHNGF